MYFFIRSKPQSNRYPGFLDLFAPYCGLMRGSKSTPSKIKEIKRRVALLVSELPKMDHHQQQGSPILPKQMEAAVSL